MAITINIDQKFKTYTGATLDDIETAVQADLNRRDDWFIKAIGTASNGAGMVLWTLWERRPIQGPPL